MVGDELPACEYEPRPKDDTPGCCIHQGKNLPEVIERVKSVTRGLRVMIWNFHDQRRLTNRTTTQTSTNNHQAQLTITTGGLRLRGDHRCPNLARGPFFSRHDLGQARRVNERRCEGRRMQGTTATSGEGKGTLITNLNKPKGLRRKIFCCFLLKVVSSTETRLHESWVQIG
ncbi:hypothetical protein BDV06DRAFT_6026 [Aspergillus oleicola]